MSKRPGDPGYADGWCIHYRAPNDENTCEAGINYDDLRNGRGDWMNKSPCFTRNSQDPDWICAHFRPPTKDEIELHEGWMSDRLNMLRTAAVGIAPWREKHKGQSIADVVECPVCSGRLHLSMSSVNGHVHGKCETEGCVSWME